MHSSLGSRPTGKKGTTPQAISFDLDDGLPKYVAISRAIELAITERQIKAGDPLPAQKELAEGFGVTLMTVRQAIKQLEDKGLVATVQGRGTFARVDPIHLEATVLGSFTDQLAKTGKSLTTVLLGYGEVGVSPLEQRRMGLPSPSAFEVTRLRVVDGRPLVLQTSLISPQVADAVDPELLATESLYQVLKEKAGITIAYAQETAQAVILDAESAGLLECEVGAPAFLLARLSFSDSDEAIVDDRALTAGSGVVISLDKENGSRLHPRVLLREPEGQAGTELREKGESQ